MSSPELPDRGEVYCGGLAGSPGSHMAARSLGLFFVWTGSRLDASAWAAVCACMCNSRPFRTGAHRIMGRRSNAERDLRPIRWACSSSGPGPDSMPVRGQQSASVCAIRAPSEQAHIALWGADQMLNGICVRFAGPVLRPDRVPTRCQCAGSSPRLYVQSAPLPNRRTSHYGAQIKC